MAMFVIGVDVYGVENVDFVVLEALEGVVNRCC